MFVKRKTLNQNLHTKKFFLNVYFINYWWKRICFVCILICSCTYIVYTNLVQLNCETINFADVNHALIRFWNKSIPQAIRVNVLAQWNIGSLWRSSSLRLTDHESDTQPIAPWGFKCYSFFISTCIPPNWRDIHINK